MITLQESLNENVCYVKTVSQGEKKFYYIHAFDGHLLTAVDNRDVAFATARQHDMLPMSLH